MNDREREMWVLNDEPLYRWFQVTGWSMRRFIREKRKGIDEYLQATKEGRR